MSQVLPLDDEFMGFIVEEDGNRHPEFERLNNAVGEMTSAILDCKTKGLLKPEMIVHMREYLTAFMTTLKGGE
jgi:hypothetical protein